MNQTARTTCTAIRGLAGFSLLAASAALAPVTIAAQVYHACYAPSTGTVYRIKTANAPAACKSGHVEFNWDKSLELPYEKTVTSTGTAFRLVQSGTGTAALFQAASGMAMSGRATTGVGVHGQGIFAGSVGVKAEASNVNNTALEITRGAIRVTGAGENTNTAAFWFNTKKVGYDRGVNSDYHSCFDNPHVNSTPNAIVLVTPIQRTANLKMTAQRYAVYYNQAKTRWCINYAIDNENVHSNIGADFNVLVIKG